MKELSDVGATPKHSRQLLSRLDLPQQHPPPKDLESLPGSPDNGLIKETAFCSNKTPRERDIILFLLSYHCLLIIAQFPFTFLDMNFALKELEKLIHDLSWQTWMGSSPREGTERPWDSLTRPETRLLLASGIGGAFRAGVFQAR